MSNCPAKFDFLENMAVFIEAEVRKTWVAVKLHDRNWRRLGRAEVKRRIAEAVHSSYLSEGKKTGWVCPDPRQVHRRPGVVRWQGMEVGRETPEEQPTLHRGSVRQHQRRRPLHLRRATHRVVRAR
jgi:hypothetical protein